VFRVPTSLPQQTFYELRALQSAFADAPLLRHWEDVPGEGALAYRFASTSVIGARPGRFRDPHTRERLDLTCGEPLFGIVAAPRFHVTLRAGEWLARWRGNRQVLTDFGDVLPIAAIASGKPSGAWAQSVGLALQQRWRERAARARWEPGDPLPALHPPGPPRPFPVLARCPRDPRRQESRERAAVLGQRDPDPERHRPSRRSPLLRVADPAAFHAWLRARHPTSLRKE
jgi:hypothetical protein